MVPPRIPALLLICLTGCASTVYAQQPVRLPSVFRLRPGPVEAQQTPQQAAIRQTAHLVQADGLPQPQDPQGLAPFPGPVDWKPLVGYALANNPEIQAARWRARALGAQVPQAASLPDPQLVTTVFLEEIQTAAGPQEMAMSLSQKLPWFGKQALRSEVAYHQAMAAYAELAATELSVVEQVKRAYFDVYYLQRAIDETRRLRPRLEDVITVVRSRYETNAPGVGLESVLQAEIELSKLQTDLIRFEQDKAKAQAQLVAVLHLAPAARIEPAAELDRSEPAQKASLLIGLAESVQPELVARRREYCRDRSSIDLACRDYWPDVTVGLNYNEIGSSGLSPVANGRDAFSIGVGVNLPIYHKRLDAAVREARYQAASSARRYSSARDRLRSEIQTLYAQFEEHDRVLKVLESEIVPRAAQALELSVESYRTGRREFQQMIDAYRTLLQYRIDLHRREALREQALASLERAVGTAISAE